MNSMCVRECQRGLSGARTISRGLCILVAVTIILTMTGCLGFGVVSSMSAALRSASGALVAPTGGALAKLLDGTFMCVAVYTEPFVGPRLLARAMRPDGTLTAPQELATAFDPRHAKLRDINDDGTPDALVLGAEGVVGFHLIDPATLEYGPFQSIDSLPPGRMVSGMEVVKVGGAEGAAGARVFDVVVVATDTTNPMLPCELWSYRCNGDADFAPAVLTTIPQAVPPMPQVYFISALDADDDGLDDLALCAEMGRLNNQMNSALVMRATGTGTFQVHANLSSLPACHAIKSGDVTGDGICDITLSGANSMGQPRIRLFAADGKGQFFTHDTLSLEGFDDLAGLEVHNFDNLNGADILVNRGNRLECWANLGDGEFDLPQTILGGSFMVDVFPCDEDGDDVTDALIAFDYIDRSIRDFRRVSAPGELARFIGETRVTTATASSPWNATVCMAEVDGDGDDDACVLGPTGYGRYISSRAGLAGSYDIGGGAVVNVPGELLAMDAADESATLFEPVVAVLASDQIYAGFDFGAPLTPILSIGTGSVGAIRIADMNGDGLSDVVAQVVEPSSIVVLVNQDNGTFTASPMPADMPAYVGLEVSLDVGDIDGDLDLDIAYVRGTSNQVHILLNNGDPTGFTFHGSITADLSAQYTQGVALTDVNGDGRADLISSHYDSYTGGPTPHELYVRFAIGSAIAGGGSLFGVADRVPMEFPPSDIESADMDGDGDLDLLVAVGRAVYAEMHGVQILENDGDGGFAPTPLVARTGGFPRQVAAGQLDGVNGPEIVVMSTNEFSDAFAGLSIHTNMAAQPSGVPGYTNGDGVVDVDDLIAVILAWGQCPTPPATCPADVNHSGVVDVDDLIMVILNWG